MLPGLSGQTAMLIYHLGVLLGTFIALNTSCTAALIHIWVFASVMLSNSPSPTMHADPIAYPSLTNVCRRNCTVYALTAPIHAHILDPNLSQFCSTSSEFPALAWSLMQRGFNASKANGCNPCGCMVLVIHQHLMAAMTNTNYLPSLCYIFQIFLSLSGAHLE